MNKPIINKWIASLRSGRFKQVKKRLRTSEGFCCLGVLCEGYIQEGNDLKTEGGNGYFIGVEDVHKKYDGSHSYLPIKVMDWAGINEAVHERLVNMNDREGATFDQIADYLEEQIK